MAQIKIGNYTLLETLGVGSFGKVKLAVHSQTGHKVAMKIVNRRKISNMDMVGRVKREIQYLKHLRHPHIIKLYEVITTPTDIIMVIEYAGGELFNYIVERGRMTEDDGRRFFQQIICAVEYCHKHNIAHRDLKPENVLLDECNQVKIADFGLSNIMADGDFLKTSCGSPNYAAPEVISGRLYEGPEVDVWSCGVILYVMLCGRLPFDDDYIPNLFKKINGGIFTLPSFLSPATKSLLSAMLVVDPLKRITIPEIRQREWFNIGLPDYLKAEKNNGDIIEKYDDAVVAEISKKMGFTADTVTHALTEVENNQIKVAYQLVADYRRMVQGAKTAFIAPHAAHPDQPPNEPLQASAQTIPPSSIKALNTLKLTSDKPPPPPPTNVKGKGKSRSKWHFGIRSRSPPFDIMLEIYRALKNCGMQWKPIDAFHIRCRHVTAAGQVVKVDIQLYKVETNNYLVDFKNATPLKAHQGHHVTTNTGSNNSSSDSTQQTDSTPPATHNQPPDQVAVVNLSAFAFFDACSKLITELAISA
ncbi:protein kinase, AMP-activated, alpha 2 catalytic subunit [Blyttiomyces sp. JEL0837]|nr:protein kinase, AMP-activated, alpha 2 catalytic subunit [Blyttiomyces sp. JEL0837]